MRAVVQRVSQACVRVGERIAGEIEGGLVVLASVGADDDVSDAIWLAEKVCGLRIFRDGEGLMNRSVIDASGAVLLVSQFTLHGDARKGRRPSFVRAAKGERARTLFERAGSEITARGVRVAYGEFGADMKVELVNDGPVTLLLDSKREF